MELTVGKGKRDTKSACCHRRVVLKATTMSYQLTAGSCEQLQTAAPSDAAIFDSPHTIQFLSIKKVSNPSTSNSAPVDRYRIIISDGVHFTQAMLATQLNNMVVEGTITKHSVAVVEKATCNTVQGKRYARV